MIDSRSSGLYLVWGILLILLFQRDSFSGQGAQEPWNLDRIDQDANGLDGEYVPPAIGWGTTIYILDTGVRITHEEFGDRARWATNGRLGDFTGDEWGRNNGADDCNGHGTHVAGIAAGATWGVAPAAQVRALRVADCKGVGTPASLFAAIDWLDEHAELPAVVLMSLDYGNIPSIREAVSRSVARGLTYVVAAGDSLVDACLASPGGARDAITVAAVDARNRQTPFSNYGPCIDLFAPGKDVRAASFRDDWWTETRRGSSIAAAHAAGVASIFLEMNPDATPCDVEEALITSAIRDAIVLTASSAKFDSPNRLLRVPALLTQR